MPSLSSFLPGVMPGRALLDDERRDALAAGRAIGDRHHHHDVADAAVRDERLGSVEHPARRRRASRSCACSRRRCRRSTRSGPRRRASRRARAARGTAVFCASVPNRKMCDAQRPLCAATDSAMLGIDARELLDADAVVDRRHAGAAVLLGILNAEQAERRQLRHQLGGKVLRLIPFADVRADFGFGELAHACGAAVPALRSDGSP